MNRTAGRLAGVATAALLALLTLLSAAAPASAEVRWRITSEHGPQNFAPGGIGQYVIQPFNVGTTATSSDFTITDALPAGVTAIDRAELGPLTQFWSCSGIPGPLVTCTFDNEHGGAVAAPSGLATRGVGPQLALDVAISPGAEPGLRDNTVTVSGGGPLAAPSSSSDPTLFATGPAGFGFSPEGFGADAFDAARPAGAPARQAGSHPFEMRVDFHDNLALLTDPDNGRRYTAPEGHVRDVETRLPAGMLGNPQATPKCASAELVADYFPQCPANSQVGTVNVSLNDGENIGLGGGPNLDVPVYNMTPPPGAVAAFAFQIGGQPVYIDTTLDPAHRYSVIARLSYVDELLPLRWSELTLWGVPADPAHDPLRFDGHEDLNTPSTAPIKPFLTMPSQCEAAGAIELRADSWQNPGAFTPWRPGAAAKMTGCEDQRFRFEPSIAIQPTSHEAAAPTGLEVDLTVPQKEDGFESSDPATNAANAAKLYAESESDKAIATPPLRDAVTRLPPGMAVNPSAADGLAGCSEEAVGLGTNEPPTCPDSSKIGTVEIESPLVPDALKGFIYQARQFENPHHSLLGFYTVAEGDGLSIKLAAEVKADPQTGDLTTVFTDNPQLAFTHYRLHFWGGQRAPLVNPPACGTYTGSGTFTSWNSSVPVVTSTDATHITSGPNGSPCPSGQFSPSFKAGAGNPLAGAFSPFALEVSRDEGTQGFSTIDTTLPAGTLAKLAGIPYCPEATLASIPTAVGTGVGERANPSCPAASLVGHVDAAAGAGLPFHNPGSVYLAGPYRGAPLSLAVVTPVVGGPLDLGNIVVRAALFVDPLTAQVRAVSDPLPSMIAGIPLNLRSLRVSMDRPEFTLNPTSCEPSAVSGTIGGLAGSSANVSDRFQVGYCAALGFKPTLKLRLKGKHNRGAHPALRAVLKMPARGQANIARVQVTLPHAEFLDQGHIRNVCTQVQFHAAGCPTSSILGHATAWSPLLAKPLSGPVYLMSGFGHKLPDLAADLNGQIRVLLHGKIDTGPGGGIRTTFETVPDAPVTKFVLSLKGGSKGLIVNSENVCLHPQRAVALFNAHNGRIHDTEPPIATGCGGMAHPHRKRH